MSALETVDLTVRFGTGARALVAVDRVALQVPSGKVVALVGESGSGKSTLARAIVGLAPTAAGRVLVDDQDLTQVSAARRRALRRRVQMVFQDPYGSLDPRMTVGETLAEALAARGRVGRAQRAREVSRVLDLVALDRGFAGRLPRELSGGQRQRVAIARALAVEPGVLIADEVTSALDVSVQGAILNLLRELRDRLGLSILFITHNLSLARYLGDAIAVMYLGRIVERGAVEEVVADPRHPYTRTLLDAVPTLEGAERVPSELDDDDPPDPHDPPAGCHFHPRCPIGPRMVADRDVCIARDPWEGAAARPHAAACHFAAERSAVRSA
jgi:peptide/nickel transport system ATP-binding protein